MDYNKLELLFQVFNGFLKLFIRRKMKNKFTTVLSTTIKSAH